MRNATPEERLAALRMLRNEQRTGDSTPRSRNRFSQRLSRTFGSRPHSGAATPRRNSGVIATAEASPTVETHPATEMESTVEERSSTLEPSAGGLSPTVEEPPSGAMAQVEEAHAAVAPHAAGSAHTVEVPRPSAEASRFDGTSPSTVAFQTGPAEHPNAVTPPTTGTKDLHEASYSGTSIPPASSEVATAASETAHTSTPNPTAPSFSAASGSPSKPNIAPFYSYR